MSGERIVLAMRWGELYPPGYVNVLYSGVKRQISGPFRFVCLTNDCEGLDPGIETFPIPDLGYSDYHWKSGAWPKLSVFLPDLYGLRGRAVFIDLDSIILKPLEPFFEEPGEFISIGGGPNWRRGRENPKPELASGVFAFDLGSQPQVVEAFVKDPKGAFDEFKLEQNFLEAHVTSWQPWPDGWITSFKRHLRRPPLVDLVLDHRKPDPNAKIVAFHGDPRPIDVVRKGNARWAKFPHAGRGPINWVRQYWLDNGYRDDI
ncbi:MAG: hypothetical protein HKN18_13740 [Silicimonas sp.]|nr:hypothetical protein [Silicimonas sp.]